VSDNSLRSIQVEKSEGRLVALGSEDGTTTVLHLSSGLSTPHADEKHQIGLLFEREAKREKNLELRAIQRKNKRREDSKAPPPAFDPFAEDPEPVKKQVSEIEQYFYSNLDLTPESVPTLPEAKVITAEPDSTDDEEELMSEEEKAMDGKTCTLTNEDGKCVAVGADGKVNCNGDAKDAASQFKIDCDGNAEVKKPAMYLQSVGDPTKYLAINASGDLVTQDEKYLFFKCRKRNKPGFVYFREGIPRQRGRFVTFQANGTPASPLPNRKRQATPFTLSLLD
jgi:hypothetical protein